MSSFARYISAPLSASGIRFSAALFFTAATVVSAHVSFRLGFTPVPVTLQVLTAILSGLVLGSRLGALSQAQYVAIGLMGFPVFAEGKAGPAALAGPTGGYIAGFVAGAFVAGLVSERFGARSKPAAFISGCAGVAAIHVCGAGWLTAWIAAAGGGSLWTCLHKAWLLGICPFIGIDVLKAMLASSLALGGSVLYHALHGNNSDSNVVT